MFDKKISRRDFMKIALGMVAAGSTIVGGKTLYDQNEKTVRSRYKIVEKPEGHPKYSVQGAVKIDDPSDITFDSLKQLVSKYEDIIYGEKSDYLPTEYKSLYFMHESDIIKSMEKSFDEGYKKVEENKKPRFLKEASILWEYLIPKKNEIYYIKTKNGKVCAMIPDFLRSGKPTWIEKILTRDFQEYLR
jgi:hypothetical protein